MKFIKPQFKIINQTDFSLIGIKKFIERCARVTYKTENLITDISYIRFFDNIIKQDHSRCLEFGTIYLIIPYEKYKQIQKANIINGTFNQIWLKTKKDKDNIYVSTNYRVINEWINNKNIPFNEDDLNNYIVNTPNSLHYPRYTVKMILDRGAMDDFRTHVTMSFLGESTRWCDYTKDRFDNQLTFVIPIDSKIKEHEYQIKNFNIVDNTLNEIPVVSDIDKVTLFNYANAERVYTDVMRNKHKPDIARRFFPLGGKSELIACGFGDAWKNFFYRRNDKHAHPMCQFIAKGINEEFEKTFNEFKQKDSSEN